MDDALTTANKILKPHFQKNKDWNQATVTGILTCILLKPHFQKNKDWNILLSSSIPFKVSNLKPHFQKNKDWNKRLKGRFSGVVLP